MTALPGQRHPTVPLPRLRVLCGRPLPGGFCCHLVARHDAGCLPPPTIRRPHQW